MTETDRAKAFLIKQTIFWAGKQCIFNYFNFQVAPAYVHSMLWGLYERIKPQTLEYAHSAMLNHA